MQTDEWGYEIDRAKAQRYAYRHGFFWLPCPICGFEYGGHESDHPFIPVRGRKGVFQGFCRRHPNAETEYVYVPAHVERI